MSDQYLETQIFGRDVSFTYSDTWIGYSLLALRLVMGWVFFSAGIQQVADPQWSARSFLLYGVADANPFVGLWTAIANDWAWLVTPLNQVGLTLIGLGLLFGVLVRLSSFFGGIMFTFYWLAAFPLENGWLIDDHVVYVLILFGLGAFGAGRILGVDIWLEKLSIVEQYPGLKLLLG